MVRLDGANKAGQELDNLGKKGGGLGDVFKTGAMIAGGAILGLGAALVGATAKAAEEEVGIARLNNTLKNSIPNWDGNTDAVEAYISKQEQLAFADDELRDSLNFLVGQTGDLAEAQALQTTAMDLARSSNIDLATATKAVGKVDQDSIGILKKLGIQVTENMTSEEALTAIRAKSAGASEAYANTTAGAMERIQNTFSNVIETIGGAILPLISGPLQAFADWFQSPEVQAGIQSIATLIGETLVGAFQFFQNAIAVIMPIIQPFIDAIMGFFGALGGGTDVMTALGGYFNDLGAAVTNAWNIVAPALGTLLGNIVQWIVDNGPTILATLAGWAANFATWVWNDAIPALLEALGGLLSGLFTWIGENGPGILTQLGTWATQFWQWIVNVTPTVLSTLGTFISDVWKWIVDNGPTILLQLGAWALAFIGWILPMIPPLLLELGKILLEITKWIVFTALPAVIVELVKLAGAFLGWIAKDVLPKLGEELGKIWKAITGWFAEILGLTPDQAKPVGEAAAAGIGTGFTTQWTSVEDDCVRAYCGLPAACEAGITAAATSIYDVGCNAAIGIADGFCDTWAAEEARCVAAYSSLSDALNACQLANSPAKALMPVGANAAQGIGAGFAQDWPGVSTGIVTMFGGLLGVIASDFAEKLPAITAIVDTMKGRLKADFAEVGAAISTLKGIVAADFPEIARLAAVLAQDMPGTLAPLHAVASDLSQAFHDAATQFALDMAAMTAAYNAMKARLESGVSVGTTTVYNGNNGEVPIPGGGGGGGNHRVLGSIGAGNVGIPGGINIGTIIINPAPGSNGREFAADFVEGLEYELGISIATRMPEIRVTR